MSSDSEQEDPQKIRASQGAMRSLFASDRRAVENGPQSLKYDPRTSSTTGTPLPGQQAQSIAAQGAALVYRGEQAIGPCLVAVMVPATGSTAFIVIVNREKKPQCRIRIDHSLQLLINETDATFATVYDSSLQIHWMMQFKTATDTQNFVVSALTVQHYVLLADGQAPNESYVDIKAPEHGKAFVQAKSGDSCHVGYKVWLVQRVGSTPLYTAGKVVEEVPQEAPKSITIGTNNAMLGLEEALKGCTKGTKRLVFIPSKKTRLNGLGNPEIGASDSVVVSFVVNSVDKAQATDELGFAKSDTDSSDEEALTSRKANKKRLKSKRNESNDDLALIPNKGVKLLGAPSVAPATPPVSSPVGLDTNALLQTVLLQSLQQQQKPSQPEVVSNNAASADVQRSVERLHYQIQSLYDKIDRIDFEKYLQTNNQVIERIVKKAVGKMPVNDVDVEDVTKDRNELLALIEQLKGKNQELTDNYHKALETLGKHKDETSALKNDLLIEREAASQRYTELKERKRLELVDLEVKHRRDMDKLFESRFEEGRKKGYDEGYNCGKIDAIQISGSSSMDEMKQMLHKKDSENVELQSRIAQMEGRMVQERREFKDQIDALNNLIARMEDRRSTTVQDFANDVTAQTKRIRRVMNSLYASIEEQFYATESERIPVSEALAMVLVSVKTETRSAVDEIKNEAAIRDLSDKSNRNEVVDAYTIAAAELNRGVHRRTKHDGAEDILDNVSPQQPDESRGADDIEKMRKELEAFESRMTTTEPLMTEAFSPDAPGIPDFVPAVSFEHQQESHFVPEIPFSDDVPTLPTAAAAEFPTANQELEEHLYVPEIPFE